mgnify:CR=1 FL=1|tara:strand:- start:1605 stop:1799 length:195 start_codon:yes stop_codon:yes gene_type:complete
MQNKINKIGYIIDKLAYFESKLNELNDDTCNLASEIGLERAIDNLNKIYIELEKKHNYPVKIKA